MFCVPLSGSRCHVLTLVILLCLCFSMIRAWVGWVVYVRFSMLGFVFGLVWFSIRGRCRSLSLIENHTLVAFSHLCFVGDYFPFQCLHHSGLFRFSFCFSCSFCILYSFSLNYIMDTYHAAFWSSDPSYYSSSEEEEESRYSISLLSDTQRKWAL